MQVNTPAYNIARETFLAPEDTALLVIDMQNDFVRENGKLYVPSSAKTVAPIEHLIKKARKSSVSVIYSQDWHLENDPEFAIWGEHALAESWGAEIIPELAPKKGDLVIRKQRYDAFFGTPLDYILRIRRKSTLVITGTVANICVLHTAASAALRWYKVVLVADAISALDDFDYYATLRQVDFLYKGTITRSRGIHFARKPSRREGSAP
jgi:nicotinamidase-related amidase